MYVCAVIHHDACVRFADRDCMFLRRLWEWNVGNETEFASQRQTKQLSGAEFFRTTNFFNKIYLQALRIMCVHRHGQEGAPAPLEML